MQIFPCDVIFIAMRPQFLSCSIFFHFLYYFDVKLHYTERERERELYVVEILDDKRLKFIIHNFHLTSGMLDFLPGMKGNGFAI